jgi:hypothetical protein
VIVRVAVFISSVGAALVLASGVGAGPRGVGCPHGLLQLEVNSIGPASAAALAREDPKSLPLVVSAILANADANRGPIAKHQCGTQVWNRTIVVYIRLRAFAPSASLTSRVSFVGRFKSGYRVWQIVH